MKITCNITNSKTEIGKYYIHVQAYYLPWGTRSNPFIAIVPNLETNLEPIQEFLKINKHIDFFKCEVEIRHSYDNALNSFI